MPTYIFRRVLHVVCEFILY